MTSLTYAFVDPKGQNWGQGGVYNNISVGQVVTANAQVDADATSISITYNMEISTTLFTFGNAAVGGINLIIGGVVKAIFRQKDISFGGCDDPIAPTGYKDTYTLTSSEVQSAISAGAISLSAWGCGNGTGTENYNITAYSTQDVPSSDVYENVSITVNNPVAKPITNISVVLQDQYGSQLSSTTNGSGIAEFKNVKDGTYQIKITYNPFANVDRGITVAPGQADFSVTMQCPSGGQYQLGVCVAGGIPGQIVTAMEVAGAVGGGLLLTYGVVKTLPKTIPYARRGYSAAREKIHGVYHRIRG